MTGIYKMNKSPYDNTVYDKFHYWLVFHKFMEETCFIGDEEREKRIREKFKQVFDKTD